MTRIAILILALVLLPGQAVAHNFWINKGRYVSPAAAGKYRGQHCCGVRDCYAVTRDVDFIAAGDVWLFVEGPASERIREAWDFEIAGATWPRDLSQTYRSEDTSSWVCVGSHGIRCFFFDQGGF